jgi:ankyrin repeat protein
VVLQLVLLDTTDDIGNDALMLACRSGSLDCVQLLLGYGAELDVVNEGDLTPLMMAARSGSPYLVAGLLNGGDPSIKTDARDSEDMTALLHACRKGQPLCIQYLLSMGASLSDTDSIVSPHLLCSAQLLAVSLINPTSHRAVRR